MYNLINDADVFMKALSLLSLLVGREYFLKYSSYKNLIILGSEQSEKFIGFAKIATPIFKIENLVFSIT